MQRNSRNSVQGFVGSQYVEMIVFIIAPLRHFTIYMFYHLPSFYHLNAQDVPRH